jgi:hypothetical protein
MKHLTWSAHSKMMNLVMFSTAFLWITTQPLFGSTMTLEDFGDLAQGQWEFIGDNVMGGISTGKIEFHMEDGISYIRLRGNVSTENNGGFIQARRGIERLTGPAAGFGLQARGNGEDYFVHIRTSRTILPWQYYQARFRATEDWQEVNLKLSDFQRSGRMLPKTLRPELIKSIAIVAYGQNYEADLSVARIDIFTDENDS